MSGRRKEGYIGHYQRQRVPQCLTRSPLPPPPPFPTPGAKTRCLSARRIAWSGFGTVRAKHCEKKSTSRHTTCPAKTLASVGTGADHGRQNPTRQIPSGPHRLSSLMHRKATLRSATSSFFRAASISTSHRRTGGKGGGGGTGPLLSLLDPGTRHHSDSFHLFPCLLFLFPFPSP